MPRAGLARVLAALLPLAAAAAPLGAAPRWQAPERLVLGTLQTLELVEGDPARPAPGRPALEDRLGPLHLRAVEPLPDGRGWRFQVQALAPGLAVVPPLDLGDGARSPELRLPVARTVPFGAPWRGLGGGPEDQLPAPPFPWAWASLGLLPLLGLGLGGAAHWRARAGARRLARAREAFRAAWPPAPDRAALDAAHARGRDLLAARWGEPARAWGPADLAARGLAPWAAWCRALDAARFGAGAPDLPAAEALLGALDEAPGEPR